MEINQSSSSALGISQINERMLTCIKIQDLNGISEVLSAGFNMNSNLKCFGGVSCVEYALKENLHSSFRFLIEKGADVNKRRYDNLPVICIVAYSNNKENVSYLLETAGHKIPIDDIKSALSMIQSNGNGYHEVSSLIENYLLNLIPKEATSTYSSVAKNTRVRL